MGSRPSSGRARPQEEAILKRGVAEIVVETEFRKLLASGRSLRLKMGFDPSRPDIHLGHVVGLRKLRQLQDLGHQVILIVGDWTARIGDPSGQSVTRPMLTEGEVKANAETYMKQFFKVVDREKTEVAWQSQWFDAFALADVIKLASRFTVAQFLAREDFRKRFEAGQPLGIHELLYPLLQAYDSIAVRADVEFGGTDQKFNLLVGRELQAMLGQTPQQCFLVPILVGTDGVQKMSKSLGNYIAVEDPPQEMYGKVMSIPDSLILPYFELLSDVRDDDINRYKAWLSEGSVNPMEIKKMLAWEIVRQFHGKEAGEEALREFERVFRQRQVPEKVEELRVSFDQERVEFAKSGLTGLSGHGKIWGPHAQLELYFVSDTDIIPGRMPAKFNFMPVNLVFFLARHKIVKSKAEARRLLLQGAVELDGSKMPLAHGHAIGDGSILKIGKRRFLKIVNTDAEKLVEQRISFPPTRP